MIIILSLQSWQKNLKKQQFTSLGENTEKYITFTVSVEKEVARIVKNGEEITKIYLTYYSLLIVKDLWQAHYQIVSITFLKELIELNVNSVTMVKNVKHVELNISIAAVFMNTQILKMI